MPALHFQIPSGLTVARKKSVADIANPALSENPRAKAPLVLGNEGAGVIEDAGDSGLAVGSRVMFTGPCGVNENGAWQEWLLARHEDLALVPVPGRSRSVG